MRNIKRFMNAIKFAICFLFFASVVSAETIERKVHYKLKKHEIIFYDEYVASFKFENQSFACVIEDTITKIKTFIWNGQKKITGTYINCHYIDFDDYDQCIIYYAHGKDKYLKIENNLYGPYERIEYPIIGENEEDSRTVGYLWHNFSSETMNTWFYKNCFLFQQLNKEFLYLNGKIYLASDEKCSLINTLQVVDRKVEGENIFKSLDGTHSAAWYPTYILYENVSYQLPFESGDTFEGGKLYLFDDGSCFGEIRRCNRQNSSPERITRIYIHEGKMNILALDEVFNFRKQCIEKIQNSRDMNDYQAFFKKPYYNNRSYEIIDPTRRHYLISDIEYPYVVIDNKKYGKECAIHAWYRAEENAFLGITLENNQLVSYCYKI